MATSNFVAHIVPTASSNSGVRSLLGTPQPFLMAENVPLSRSRCVITAKRVLYAMESEVVENDLDKGDEQLFHYLEIRHTEGSCRCIQQKCTHPCCSNTVRHVNETRTSSEKQDKRQLTSCNPDVSTHHVTLLTDESRSYCLLRHVTYVQAVFVFKRL